MRMRRGLGFSLIEVLVVLVIVLIGVLSVLRIFPRGLVGLSNTRDYTIAMTLARSQVDRLEAGAEDLPSRVLAVKYTYVLSGGMWNLVLLADPDTSPKDLSPGGQLLDDGTIEITNPGGGSNTYIPWRYYNDANRVRRIIGEGGKIPAPKVVGNDFGGLKMLSFAPVVNDPRLLLVYGDELEPIRVEGTQPNDPGPNPRPWSFFHDDEAAQVWLYVHPTRTINYKINFSYWLNVNGQLRRSDVIDLVVPAPPTLLLGNGQVRPLSLYSLAGNPPGWVGLDHYSVEVNRLFDSVNVFDPNYPYEYKVLNGNLGSLLFNPAGYNYMERRGRNRVPLRAQINYDVFNWHIISDEFRADRTRSPIQKLSLQRIKAFNDLQNDRRRYQGLEVPVPDGTGNLVSNRDVVVVDLDSGGIVSPRIDPANANSPLSYKVDYLRGVIAMASPLLAPPQNSNELSDQGVTIVPPDGSAPITGINPAGRNFRVFYQAHDDWAVQIFKAPARISVVWGLPLGIAQAYVGNTPQGPVGLPTRVYFPLADLGSKVTVREIWYRDTNNNLKVLRDQDFLIRPALSTDPLSPYPSIDIREADASAAAFDFNTYGYAVRGIAGSSIRARVIWTKAEKEDLRGNNPAQLQERMDLHEAWTRQWRSVDVQSYLTRRDRN